MVAVVATVSYGQALSAGALRRFLTSKDGGLGRDLMRRGLNVMTQARRNLGGGPSGPKRIDTGRLRSAVGPPRLTTRNGELAVLIGANVFYARFVHDGTGVHGPRHRPIRPRFKKLLKFKIGNKAIYAKQVQGMTPNRFLAHALRTAAKR